MTPYGVSGTIKIIGRPTGDVALENSKLYSMTTFHVVSGKCGSLIGYSTANQLGMLSILKRNCNYIIDDSSTHPPPILCFNSEWDDYKVKVMTIGPMY